MRYAVLHHTGIDEPHFDFMFETSSTSQLTTFRISQWPILESQAATKLRDHRRAYLTLQGDISMGRGHVQRVDEGELIVKQIGQGWQLSNADGQLFATFEPLTSVTENDWWVRLST